MRFNEYPIGDLVDKCQTWNPRSSGAGTFDYIDLSSVDKETKSISLIERFECADAPSRARQIVETDDVLVATVRPNLNGVALVRSAHHGMTASTGYCVLRPQKDKLDSRFLIHWVRTGVFVQRMLDVATGASYPAVSDAKVKASTIPLPPLDEQKRIAGILDAADALRAKRRESLAQLDTLLQSTFLDMFGDPVTNPMGWEKPILETICRPKQWPTIKRAQLLEAGYPVYGANGRIGFYSAYNHAESTVLITCRGATCGTINVCEPMSYVTGNAMALDDLDKDRVELAFLARALDETDFNAVITGVAQPQITRQSLKQLTVPIPPLDLQRRFATISESIRKQKASQRAHLAELDTLFASLQSRAFRGDL